MAACLSRALKPGICMAGFSVETPETRSWSRDNVEHGMTCHPHLAALDRARKWSGGLRGHTSPICRIWLRYCVGRPYTKTVTTGTLLVVRAFTAASLV